jgi:tRNA pseudouridine38-40 synthase
MNMEYTGKKSKNVAVSGIERVIRLTIAFDGTEFDGWQSQPSGNTVQDVVSEKISRLTGESVKITGCGRTDAGVHASGYVLSFDVPSSSGIPDENFKKALNSLLPPSVKVIKSVRAPAGFNARFSALAKTYTYVINTGDATPFDVRWAWRRNKFELDGELRKALSLIEGEHDFSSFTVKRNMISNAVRTIYEARADIFGKYICLSFTGSGFLYKMVRSIIGTLAFVAAGKITSGDVKKILERKDRSFAPPTAPALGLFLVKVYYEGDIFTGYIPAGPPFYYNRPE